MLLVVLDLNAAMSLGVGVSAGSGTKTVSSRGDHVFLYVYTQSSTRGSPDNDHAPNLLLEYRYLMINGIKCG